MLLTITCAFKQQVNGEEPADSLIIFYRSNNWAPETTSPNTVVCDCLAAGESMAVCITSDQVETYEYTGSQWQVLGSSDYPPFNEQDLQPTECVLQGGYLLVARENQDVVDVFINGASTGIFEFSTDLPTTNLVASSLDLATLPSLTTMAVFQTCSTAGSCECEFWTELQDGWVLSRSLPSTSPGVCLASSTHIVRASNSVPDEAIVNRFVQGPLDIIYDSATKDCRTSYSPYVITGDDFTVRKCSESVVHTLTCRMAHSIDCLFLSTPVVATDLYVGSRRDVYWILHL